MSRALPEPWRVKVVEKIELLSREERERLLEEGGFSLFKIPSEAVFVDMFTDSGTSAMSDWQWAGMMQGDEAYAGARNFFNLEKTINDVFGFPHFLPVHQGRVAENLLFSTILTRPGMIIPNNCHFDTTRANIEVNGGVAVDLVIAEGRNPQFNHPFKGNMDVNRLRRLFVEKARDVPVCMLTLTNNSGGGQPVSLANVKAVAELCREFDIPFYIDACRFAENAWFIKTARGGAGRPLRRRDRARGLQLRRRLHHERQEGRPGQHRRLPGDPGRGAAGGPEAAAHRHRGFPDLRRPRRAGPRSRVPRPARGAGRELPPLPRGPGGALRRPAHRGGDPDHEADRRPRRLHRRQAAPAAHPARGSSRRRRSPWPSTARAACGVSRSAA